MTKFILSKPIERLLATTKLVTLSSIVLILSACSSSMNVSTNLDKENFNQYFAASSVKVYEDEQSIPGKYQYLSLVEGESCQLKSNDAPANNIDARTDARKKAASLHADAIVFTTCVAIEDKQCKSMQVCYGKSFKQLASK